MAKGVEEYKQPVFPPEEVALHGEPTGFMVFVACEGASQWRLRISGIDLLVGLTNLLEGHPELFPAIRMIMAAYENGVPSEFLVGTFRAFYELAENGKNADKEPTKKFDMAAMLEQIKSHIGFNEN